MTLSQYRQVLLAFLFLLALIIPQPSNAKNVNVYVKYDNTKLEPWINQFNQYLSSKGIFNKYDVQPLLYNYPLHSSLYLSDYPLKNIEKLISTTQQLALQYKSFSIETSDVVITDNGYVMLNLNLSKQADGKNHPLQLISDNSVSQLQFFRNTKATIPPWAKELPSKQRAFERYGSPNVYFEFSPHFTLIAKDFNSKAMGKNFQKEIRELANEFVKANPSHLWLKARSIGIGIVDNYGQIVQELASFPLL